MQAATTPLRELSERVRESHTLRVLGAGTKREWRPPELPSALELSLRGYCGIVDYSPNDQVVAVRAGTLVTELQEELAGHAQCLPFVDWNDGWSLSHVEGTIGGSCAVNLPHVLEAECGSWRDWVLGMTLILADGTVAKTGSHAVKNVAGYDIHKLMIGSRGTLAVIAEVILRTYPLRSLPTPTVRMHRTQIGPVQWVQRVLRTDFEAACLGAGEYTGVDIPGTSTIWRHLPTGIELPRFAEDWVLRSGNPLRPRSVAEKRFMAKAKAVFDSSGKLNPGELEI